MDDTRPDTTPRVDLTDTLTLDRLKVCYAQYLDAEFADEVSREVAARLLDDAKLTPLADAAFGRLGFALTSFVLAETIVDKTVTSTHTFESPSSWWQHFKRDTLYRLPLVRRLERRFPVLDREDDVVFTANFKQYATFPASPIRTPERHRGPITVRQERLGSYLDA